jgi:hypothetical protein
MVSLERHASPDSKTYGGRLHFLERKFLAADITSEELKEYATLLYKGRMPVPSEEKQDNKEASTSRIISVFGKPIKVSEEEYERYCKGF